MVKHLQNYFETLKAYEWLAKVDFALPKAIHKEVVAYSSETPQEAAEDYAFGLKYLPQSKIFEVSHTVAQLLLNTDANITPTRLPFSPMFIECRLQYDLAWQPQGYHSDHQTYLGFMLAEGKPFDSSTSLGQLTHLVQNGKELIEQRYPNIYIMAVTKDAQGIGHIKISLYKDYNERGEELAGNWAKERDYVRAFVMNFLDFLNDPDVELVETLRSEKSVRKALRKHKKLGAVHLSSVIRLTGKLKVYIDSLQRHIESHFHYSHRFWVRGHWRHFYAMKWINMRGLKVWIPPYVKGEGLLLPKRYYVHRVSKEGEGKDPIFDEQETMA